MTSLCFAEQIHIAHCKYGCPVTFSQPAGAGLEQGEIIVRHLYAASLSTNGLAAWAAYRVLPKTVGVASLLPRYWRLDDLSRAANALESEVGESVRLVQADLSDSQDRDYRINEIKLMEADRGRLAPMTSFAGTPYWDELNYLSNMTPLPTALRNGAWARIDQAVNDAVQLAESYYVISGPVPLGRQEGEGGVVPPDSFFKVILSADRVVAFVFPANVNPQSAFCDYRRPLAEVSAASGLDFFPNLRKTLLEDLALDLGC